MYAVVVIAAFFGGAYAGFAHSPWWFIACLPCVASVIYGMKH